jgi:hypothetical protein
MTRAVLDAIVADYVGFVNGELVAAGFPERAIYSHTGGVFGANGPHSFEPAGTGTVIPGWSMYFEGASTPSIAWFVDSTPARQVLPWSSPEWLPLDPAGGSPGDWHAAWESSLNYRNARMISLANWEGVYPNPSAIAGLGAAMTSPRADACVVVPRVVLGWADFGGTLGVRFSAARPNTVTYLNASTSSAEATGGGVASIDLVNLALDEGQTSWFATGDAPVDGWLQLVTDGCMRDGAPQRMITPLVKLSFHGTGQPPPLPRAYARRDGPIATFAWDAPPGAAEVRFQLAEDAGFASLVVDEVVTGESAYVRDGFDPAKAYAARVVVDGAPSNVVRP